MSTFLRRNVNGDGKVNSVTQMVKNRGDQRTILQRWTPKGVPNSTSNKIRGLRRSDSVPSGKPGVYYGVTVP